MIEGVQIIDPEWKYVYVNQAVASHGKSRREELTGRTMTEVYPGIDQTEMFGMLRKCMTERRYAEMVNEFDFPDGSKGYFELRMEPVPEGILILSFDITALKRAEQVLKDMNAELEMKVEQRTSELIRKNKELEQFAYVASHDLQEPLRSMMGFAKILESNYKGQLDERADKSLNYITQAATRMKNLIIALLDYSRLGQSTSKIRIDCHVLISDVLADLKQRMEDTNAIVRVNKLPTLSVYPLEFRLLMQNLIDNAIKFSKKGDQPVVEIKAKKDKKKWIFSVSDNGIGISPEHIDKIFLIFQRLHTQQEIAGTGIGLAHCLKIAEMHGGRIWVESETGNGSTFYFEIPEVD